MPVTAPASTADEIRRDLETRPYDSVTHIAVCADDKLQGIVRIEDLLPAHPDTVARDLMDKEPPVVAPGVDQEVAAWHAVQHGESALSVVDADGRFVGLIP
ncbi:MAG: CBS domain-containing protein, partial [Dehalococcoidia bacterium]|nr:CBS domain-containing protein [Dehalococcoidia bacterium]